MCASRVALHSDWRRSICRAPETAERSARAFKAAGRESRMPRPRTLHSGAFAAGAVPRRTVKRQKADQRQKDTSATPHRRMSVGHVMAISLAQWSRQEVRGANSQDIVGYQHEHPHNTVADTLGNRGSVVDPRAAFSRQTHYRRASFLDRLDAALRRDEQKLSSKACR